MVVVTIVAASVITAAAGAGITGDVAVPADGTGITGKHSVTDSVKAMMPVSVMDSGKDGTMTAVSFWQDYGHEILPAVNHLYYQLTARYDLPVVQYDFAALREENESDAAGSLSTTADTVNITEALAELAQNNAEAADFVADYPNRQN